MVSFGDRIIYAALEFREQPTIAIFAGPWLMFGVCSFWTSYSSNQKNYILPAYQPVFLHELIRINIKIKFIDNNYSYLSHVLFHLLNILTYTQIYIYHYLVAINFILHHTSMCIWYILIELFVCQLMKGGPGAVVEPTVCNRKVPGSSPTPCTFVWVRLGA